MIVVSQFHCCCVVICHIKNIIQGLLKVDLCLIITCCTWVGRSKCEQDLEPSCVSWATTDNVVVGGQPVMFHLGEL